jgi:hypothetical protein
MACGGCMQARQQLFQSARRYDMRGVVSAVARGVAINVDKVRGVDVNAKYGQTPVVKATPYRRPVPPDRST